MKTQTNYEARWKVVENALSKGLNASAEKEILSILKDAKWMNNTEQIIKAICNYRVSLNSRDENSRLNDIGFFEQEIKDAKFPAKQILHSMLGDLYWTYYQENRWKILDRTEIDDPLEDHDILSDGLANKPVERIETWSAQQFYAKSTSHFEQSLKEADAMKKVDIKEFDRILEKGLNTHSLRPTLYDLLVQRAIDFFQQEENEITRPSFSFEIDDAKAFDPADIFIRSTYNTSDTHSRKYMVLKLYQAVLSFHQQDKDPGAFIDADIARIRFVHDHSVTIDKDKLYVQALNAVLDKHNDHPQAAMAKYYIAETYTQGTRHKGRMGYLNSTIHEDQIDYIQARKLCREILATFDHTEAGYHAALLLQQIEAQSLLLNTEKVILPGQATLAKVQYRNINTLYCNIIAISPTELKDFDENYEENYKKLLQRNSIKSWIVELPRREDYKVHTTEIKIDALPLGQYAFFASESNHYQKDHYTTLNFLNVSELAYIKTTGANGKKSGIYVVGRDDGKPLQYVKIKSWTRPYDYNKRKNVYQEGMSYTTDQNGYVSFSHAKNQNGYLFEIIKGDDHLFINDYIYTHDAGIPQNDLIRTFLFTDRSIYRPGQTIYFKGIVVQSKGKGLKEHELLINRKTSISMLDANYQQVKQLEVSTNEYGSYSGSFTAPEGLMNGVFHLQTEGGQQVIQIEEYKRPKFEVSYDTLKETYKINDTIHVRAIAKAFAGNPISSAHVKFRVLREARFPYYWCFYRWGQPSSPSMEITHGYSTTLDDGSFDISFKAIPDLSIDPQSMPVYDYQLIADVTDLNGETRTGTISMQVSYQALLLSMNIPQVNDVREFKKLHITSTNLNGAFIETDVMLTCKKLKTPEKTYRSRLWPKVEINSFPEDSFRIFFPFDEYDHENDYLQWKEEKTIWKQQLTTNKEGVYMLSSTKYEEGWYVIEASAKDKYGERILEKKYIRLSNYQQPQSLPNEHLLVTQIKLKALPGEIAKFGISTPYENVHLLTERFGLNSNPKWMNINHYQLFEYKITEEDRGGFHVNAFYVIHNRYYLENVFVDIPWTNKELTLSMETFRDKMLPGSDQEWKIKITGSKKEKVSAELLASLYDASLDAFKTHDFQSMDLFTMNQIFSNWEAINCFSVENGRIVYYRNQRSVTPYLKSYDRINWWNLKSEGYHSWHNIKSMRGKGVQNMSLEADESMAGNELSKSPMASKQSEETLLDAVPMAEDDIKSNIAKNITLRSNFSETAFFFPDLQTDSAGNIFLKFRAPDALTRWKFLALGHTKDLKTGLLSLTSITQKDLMIVPNTPRFFREGDHMFYSAKVTNMTDQYLAGDAMIQLFDAITNQPIDKDLNNNSPVVQLSLYPNASVPVRWKIEVPQGFTNPVVCKVYVKGHVNSFNNDQQEFSDGEQNVVPVLLNSMMVTETLPLPVRTNSTRNFTFNKLLDSKSSSTLRHHRLTIEYTSNPAWYAIQALSFLTDYPYDCAEQTFNRYYANLIATHIANSTPKIKEIFSNWSETPGSSALLSNLSKNQELKSALLQETPWVLDAKNEEDQKRNLATLFNLNRMSRELDRTLRELQNLQTPNGGFAWFKGMPDDRFITQYIATGIGRLMHLNISEIQEEGIMTIVSRAIPYLDARIKEDYDDLIKQKIDLSNYSPGYYQIYYLYMRSFFLNNDVEAGANTAFEYFKKQAAKHWLAQNRNMQAMLAVALKRYGNKTIPMEIIASLRENAIHHEEMGMYWKEVNSSYWWYEAPIETQSMLIEAFKEVAMSEDEVDEMKIWLLKNKQTQNWKTSKATADACYALLLNGTYWLGNESEVNITLGKQKIESKNQIQDAGSGYFKTSISSASILPEMGNIQVKVRSTPGEKGSAINGTTWGAVYWQYFENLDKITASATPLKLKKQLFIERNSTKGPVLIPISDHDMIQVGDKIKVRIELRVDREMEYVHMRDMRGACFEPVNVLSEYKYQGGLGYYESTKDASTNFFFNRLQKGTYVFEYPMFVTHQGDYSNGIASIQCMYAPEFSSHSDGIRVLVK